MRTNYVSRFSSAPRPGRRRGITILEVLIAAGVLAIGMFGIMALIPLIAMRLREGEIADRSAVLGRNAVETALVRGWTDPRRWRWYRTDGVYVDPSSMTLTYAPPNIPIGALEWSRWDDNYLPVGPNPTGPNPALMANLPLSPAICVDPMGMTGIVGTNASRARFPYGPVAGDDRYAMQRVMPFNPSSSAAPNNPTDKAIAELMAVSEDDVLIERPESRMDLPYQTFARTAAELSNGGVALADYDQFQTRRMAQRDYSFLATLAPLDNVTRFKGEGNYLLSVAVFYQRSRVYELDEHVGFIDEDASGGYGFRSGGVSGGDVAINCSLDADMINLAKGDWVMLTYPEQRDTSVTPYVVTQAAYSRWYQVIEAVPYDPVLEPVYRFVTLAGPDWPGVDRPTAAPPIDLPDDTQVTWLPGVSQVSERTISLGADGTWE